MRITEAEMAQKLRDVGLEDAARGSLFPFGFKIVDVDGGKYLTPLTVDEYRTIVQNATGQVLTDEDIANGGCISGLPCRGSCSTGRCYPEYVAPGTFACVCPRDIA